MQTDGFQAMDYVDHIAARYPTVAGLMLVSAVFLAGLTSFKDSRPTWAVWFWWGWGLIGVVGFFGVILRAGNIWAALIVGLYVFLLVIVAWRKVAHGEAEDSRNVS